MKHQAVNGLKNEAVIIEYLNFKRFKDLNEKWKKHISTMFPFIKDDDVIYARKHPDHQAKPDAIIKVRNTLQYLSIKSGRNPSVHQEDFFTFRRFLKYLGVDTWVLRTIYFYHFGETMKISNNGVPFTKEELEERYSSYFLKASIALDKEEIIKKVINRTVIKGANNKRTALTYLYYGNVDKGFLLSKEDIYSLVLNYREHKTSIHFGGLNYQPSGRKRTTVDYRYVRIKWGILSPMFYLSEKEVRDVIDGSKRL
ncbi:MAG: hypothetical protein MJZ37_02520 [Bacilli bacterium]|nr:hypothetical protein [Bacilli bacterium]